MKNRGFAIGVIVNPETSCHYCKHSHGVTQLYCVTVRGKEKQLPAHDECVYHDQRNEARKAYARLDGIAMPFPEWFNNHFTVY